MSHLTHTSHISIKFKLGVAIISDEIHGIRIVYFGEKRLFDIMNSPFSLFWLGSATLLANTG